MKIILIFLLLTSNLIFSQNIPLKKGNWSAYLQLNANDLLLLINSMPDGYRVIFNMFAIEGYSHNDIATTLRISESTSKSQYLRAKGYLRGKLELMGHER